MMFRLASVPSEASDAKPSGSSLRLFLCAFARLPENSFCLQALATNRKKGILALRRKGAKKNRKGIA
jgi:hypothetical protein